LKFKKKKAVRRQSLVVGWAFIRCSDSIIVCRRYFVFEKENCQAKFGLIPYDLVERFRYRIKCSRFTTRVQIGVWDCSMRPCMFYCNRVVNNWPLAVRKLCNAFSDFKIKRRRLVSLDFVDESFPTICRHGRFTSPALRTVRLLIFCILFSMCYLGILGNRLRVASEEPPSFVWIHKIQIYNIRLNYSTLFPNTFEQMIIYYKNEF